MSKKIISSLIAIILSLTFVFHDADAHSGRTDQLGGHFVSKTGQYHFHSYSSITNKAKTKKAVVNLILNYNSSADNYEVNVKIIDWASYKMIYNKNLK
ncbi:YHYH domain-containing protein [Bacillus sp. OAE603]|uniref:YHYH domain-containing protein n=1 Tax=Gottfriedia sp. OAE603 TaxID=2663872 RepID=UPI0017899E42